MTALACLLIAAVGNLTFGALADLFRPVRQPLCQAPPAHKARHRAEG